MLQVSNAHKRSSWVFLRGKNIATLAKWWNQQDQKLPQHYIPRWCEKGSQEHLLFLFVLIFMTPRNNGRGLPQKISDALCPLPEDIVEALKSLNMNRIDPQWEDYLRTCLNTICQHGFGNLLSKMSVTKFDHCRQKKIEGFAFPGWGPKLHSLFRLALDEMGICTAPQDAFPVDVHTVRMCLQLQWIHLDFSSRAMFHVGELTKLLREELVRHVHNRRLHPAHVQNAIWQIGSTLCPQCGDGKMKLKCPVYQRCRGRWNTSHYWDTRIREVVFEEK